MNGISALKSSPNVNNVIKIMGYLISNDASLLFSKYFDLPPVKENYLPKNKQMHTKVFL